MQSDEILIFECLQACLVLRNSHVSINCATLQVKDSLNIFRSRNLHSMRHKHDVDFTATGNFNCVDSVNSCQQRSWVLFQVLEVWHSEVAEKEILLLLTHSFDYESLILAEKEEAT